MTRDPAWSVLEAGMWLCKRTQPSSSHPALLQPPPGVPASMSDMPRRPPGSGRWRWTWRLYSASTACVATWPSHRHGFTPMRCTWSLRTPPTPKQPVSRVCGPWARPSRGVRQEVGRTSLGTLHARGLKEAETGQDRQQAVPQPYQVGAHSNTGLEIGAPLLTPPLSHMVCSEKDWNLMHLLPQEQHSFAFG